LGKGLVNKENDLKGYKVFSLGRENTSFNKYKIQILY